MGVIGLGGLGDMAVKLARAMGAEVTVFHSFHSVAGSVIGGIRENQEVLEFCAKHGVAPDIQIIPIQEINEAHKHVIEGDARFRYVIDLASLKADAVRSRVRAARSWLRASPGRSG